LNDGKHGRKRITGRDSMNGRTGMLLFVNVVADSLHGAPVVSVILTTAACHMVPVCAVDKYKNGWRLLT